MFWTNAILRHGRVLYYCRRGWKIPECWENNSDSQTEIGVFKGATFKECTAKNTSPRGALMSKHCRVLEFHFFDSCILLY